MNGCAPGLALKLRHAATRKWAIQVAPTGFEPMSLCDASALLYQLSYEVTQSEAGQFVGLIRSLETINEKKEIYII